MIRIITAIGPALGKRVPLQWAGSCGFSKLKREKPKLEETCINISKLNEKYDGFVVYQNTDGSRFKLISLAFLFCFASGYWTYSRIDDDEIKVNYLITGSLLFFPFVVFQFRTAATLKTMVLDRTGENLILTRFKYGGFSEERTKARVEVLKGIGKAFAFGGSVIKGGGSYGLQERNYWFQSKYILERDVFEEVVQGHRIKVNKTKQYD